MQNKENHILDLSCIHARGMLFNHIDKLRTNEGPNEVEKLVHCFNLGLLFL